VLQPQDQCAISSHAVQCPFDPEHGEEEDWRVSLAQNVTVTIMLLGEESD
jgi:hypothetical protein